MASTKAVGQKHSESTRRALRRSESGWADRYGISLTNGIELLFVVAVQSAVLWLAGGMDGPLFSLGLLVCAFVGVFLASSDWKQLFCTGFLLAGIIWLLTTSSFSFEREWLHPLGTVATGSVGGYLMIEILLSGRRASDERETGKETGST